MHSIRAGVSIVRKTDHFGIAVNGQLNASVVYVALLKLALYMSELHGRLKMGVVPILRVRR